MGGYLATLYALRHPEHVHHMMLVSPAGILGTHACLPLVSYVLLCLYVMFTCTRQAEFPECSICIGVAVNQLAMPSDLEPKVVRSSFNVAGVAWRTAIFAWEGGVTPGAITRGLGPFGMGLVNRYVSGRFM
jgi:cardiolipin-specific phospholipase